MSGLRATGRGREAVITLLNMPKPSKASGSKKEKTIAEQVCEGFTDAQLKKFGKGGLKRLAKTLHRAVADLATEGREYILGLDIGDIKKHLTALGLLDED